MTPVDNIRWYWGDLTPNEKVELLTELYLGLTAAQKDKFLNKTGNN